MIEISKLNKYYKIGNDKMHALKDITLNIQNGEMLAIMGKSGAGKSTLMNMIGLLDKYDSGSLKIDGIEVSMLGDSKLAKLRNEKIGFVMQDFSLLEPKTVLMNVMLPLYFNNKYNFSNMKKIAMEMLRRVGIAEQANKKANQLSGGQKQRVAIARAIVNDPSFILADEPTGALDTKTSAEIMELFKNLNENGKTIIIITHDMGIAQACQRKIEISDGKII
ncbi:ABC transporter ATP-binding protein [Methanobrevibacter sp.]|uniref:ABC transporter ATP-binding protein n=1 Tax=Methanobrevibacter sp. TaxID=66852 RepID=UPI0038703C2C